MYEVYGELAIVPKIIPLPPDDWNFTKPFVSSIVSLEAAIEIWKGCVRVVVPIPTLPPWIIKSSPCALDPLITIPWVSVALILPWFVTEPPVLDLNWIEGILLPAEPSTSSIISWQSSSLTSELPDICSLLAGVAIPTPTNPPSL